MRHTICNVPSLAKLASWLLLSTLIGTVQAASLPSTLGLTTGETYVELHPRDGFLYIKEYYLSTLNSENTRSKQAEEISSLIRSASYCKKRYGLSIFTSMEERVFRDRGFITVECRLLTRERNLIPLMESVYSSLLNRPVQITIVSTEIGLHYAGTDVQVRSHNSLGVVEKEDGRIIFWKNGISAFESVFANAGSKPADLISMAGYLKEEVSSPEKSAAEINAWKSSK